MKKLFKILSRSCGVAFDSSVSIFSVVFFSSFSVNKGFKEQKKRREKDETCYILCNGPSLQTFLNSPELPSKNLFVVNFFANSDIFEQLKPDNYIVLDNKLVGRSDKEKMAKVNEKVTLLYERLKNVTWPLTIYYPSDGNKDIINKLKENINITVCLFNKTPVSGLKAISNFLYRLNLGMPRPQNVSNAAIFCAINSGYKKIYLYGMEHSWLKNFDVNPENHKIFANDGHFYQKENVRYYPKGDYYKVLYYQYLTFKSHFMLRNYADYVKVQIINKTPNSFIEAYEFEE